MTRLVIDVNSHEDALILKSHLDAFLMNYRQMRYGKETLEVRMEYPFPSEEEHERDWPRMERDLEEHERWMNT